MSSRIGRFLSSINSNLNLRLLLGRDAKECLEKRLAEAEPDQEFYFDFLVKETSPPSPEALAQALSLLVGQGVLDVFYRLHSERGGGGVAEYTSLEKVPEREYDPYLQAEVEVKKRNIGVFYKKAAAEDGEPPESGPGAGEPGEAGNDEAGGEGEPPPVATFPSAEARSTTRLVSESSSARRRRLGLWKRIRAYLSKPRELSKNVAIPAAAERFSALDKTTRRAAETLYLSAGELPEIKLGPVYWPGVGIGIVLIGLALVMILLVSHLTSMQCQGCRVILAFGVTVLALSIRLPGLLSVVALWKTRVPTSIAVLIVVYKFLDICQGSGA